MVKSFLIPVILGLSPILAPSFCVKAQSNANTSKKAETSTLIVRAENKKTAQVVAGAKVTVRWGDFTDESRAKESPTLETGLATFATIPREKLRVQVVAHNFETFTCLYTPKKSEEAIWIQLETKEQNVMGECVALPAIPGGPQPPAKTSPPHD